MGDIQKGDIVRVPCFSDSECEVRVAGCGSRGDLYKLEGHGNTLFPLRSIILVSKRKRATRKLHERVFRGSPLSTPGLNPKHSSGWLTDDLKVWLRQHRFLINVEYEQKREEDVRRALEGNTGEVLNNEGFTPASPGRQFWEGIVRFYRGNEIPFDMCNNYLLDLIKDNQSSKTEHGVRLINRMDAVLDLLESGFALGIHNPEPEVI